MNPLTPRQQEILDAIEQSIVDRNYPPTIRELGEEFGFSSPNGVLCHLDALEKKGLIERDEGARAIHLRRKRVKLVRRTDKQS